MSLDANAKIIPDSVFDSLSYLSPTDRADLATLFSSVAERLPPPTVSGNTELGQFTVIELSRSPTDPPGYYQGVSRKIPNTRVYIGNMLARGVRPELADLVGKLIQRGIAIKDSNHPSNLPHELAFAYSIIQFLQAARDLVKEVSTIDLQNDDARVLAALHGFAREEARGRDDGSKFWDTVRERGYLLAVRRDDFLAYLRDRPTSPLSEERALAALDRLDNLWALRYVEGDDEIHLIEAITFVAPPA